MKNICSRWIGCMLCNMIIMWSKCNIQFFTNIRDTLIYQLLYTTKILLMYRIRNIFRMNGVMGALQCCFVDLTWGLTTTLEASSLDLIFGNPQSPPYAYWSSLLKKIIQLSIAWICFAQRALQKLRRAGANWCDRPMRPDAMTKEKTKNKPIEELS